MNPNMNRFINLCRKAVLATALVTTAAFVIPKVQQVSAKAQPVPVQEAASVTDLPASDEAQKYFEEGVKYFQEAQKNAQATLLGHLLAKPVAEVAYEKFSQAIRLNPKLAIAYVYRAATSSLLGADLATVMADLQKAADVDASIYVAISQELRSLVARITSLHVQPVKAVTQAEEVTSTVKATSDPISCEEFAKQYQTQAFGTLEYLMAIQGVENARWSTGMVGVYKKALDFYIPAARCYPDQFSLELLRDVSTTLHARMKEMPPQVAVENSTLYAGMQGLADMVDQALK